MEELVCGEGVCVDHPLGIGQVLRERLGAGTVYVLRFGEVPVELIQQEEVSDKLDSRDDVAPAGPRLPVQKLFLPLGGGWADGSGLCWCRRCRRVCGGLLLGKACTRCHEGENEDAGDECPMELAGMLESAHPRLVAEPAFVDRACIDYWMPLAN